MVNKFEANYIRCWGTVAGRDVHKICVNEGVSQDSYRQFAQNLRRLAFLAYKIRFITIHNKEP